MKLSHFMIKLILTQILVGFLTTISLAQNPQPQVTQYLYDNNGRLATVIYPDTTKTVYAYDPAGNITNITNIGAQPFITSFAPDMGTAGDTITINGLFGNEPVTITFNGVTAQLASATPTQVVAFVPATATTGPITVTNQFGATTTTNFTVVAGLTIMPTRIEVVFVQTQQCVCLFPNMFLQEWY